MKKITALLKLDFQLLAPYWKWWLMFFGISLGLSLLNRSGVLFVISLTIFAGTVMAFPFESTDNSNLHVLYSILPTNRKSMVFARYIAILIIFVISLALAISTGIIIDLAFHSTFSGRGILLSTCLAFGLYMVSVGFQTPFLYRFGYKKGRIFMWIPIILVNIAIMLPALFDLFNSNITFNIFDAFFNNQTPTNLISVGVGVAALVISFIVSRILYVRRDV